jgi:glyoxylase I family protein
MRQTRLDRTLGYLQGKGVEPVWGPIFRDKYTRAEIQDPIGYLVELRQWNDWRNGST